MSKLQLAIISYRATSYTSLLLFAMQLIQANKDL